MSEIAHLGPDDADHRFVPGLEDVDVVLTGSRRKPLRVAVIGEFNSGKTSLVNALLGAAVLPTSFTTHTAYPTVIRFAARLSLAAEIANRRRVPVAWENLDGLPAQGVRRLHLGVPMDRLKTLRPIDTPGLGLADEASEERTLRACRRTDAVIWCTPAMQAWKASEERAWLTLPKSLRRRGILAVTFMDALRSASDASRLMARLELDAGPLFRKIVPAHRICAAAGADSGLIS